MIVFSQTATDSIKCVDVKFLRLVAKDLVRGDSCSAQLEVSKKEVSVLKEQVLKQELIISTYKSNELVYMEQIAQEIEKNITLNDMLLENKQELDKQRKRNLKTGIGSAVFVAILSIFL